MSVTCARCRVRGARRAPRPPQTHINGCAGCSERHASARGAVRPGRGSAAPEARAQLATSAAAVEAPASAVDAFPRGDEWTIHKFGGTCVSAAERIAEAARVVVGVRLLPQPPPRWPAPYAGVRALQLAAAAVPCVPHAAVHAREPRSLR